MDTPLTVVKNVSQCKKNSRRKGKRRHRMLTFHRKLVDVRGFPPIRLMQTPGLSSDPVEARRRNLVTDLAKEDVAKKQYGLMLGEAFVYPPGSPLSATTLPSVPMPRFWQQIGIKSGSDRFSSLCSSPQSHVVNIGDPMSAEWSEATPMYGYGFDQFSGLEGTLLQPSFGLSDRSTSRFCNLTLLSPTSQSSSIGWRAGGPTYQLQSNHVSTGGSPAYCSHCLQYRPLTECDATLAVSSYTNNRRS
jgi:hypothetical protein